MSMRERLERLGLEHLADKPEELQAELTRQSRIARLKQLEGLREAVARKRAREQNSPD